MTAVTFRILQIIRILSLVVLIFPIPLTYRLMFIYLVDSIDCPNMLVREPIPCKSFMYQWNDKLIDTISYIVINLFLFWKYPSPFNFVLLGMLLLRIKGLVEWYQTKDSNNLVWHPDLFREFSIVVSLMNDGWIRLTPLSTIVSMFVIFVAKWNVEKKLHAT